MAGTQKNPIFPGADFYPALLRVVRHWPLAQVRSRLQTLKT